MSNLVNSQRGLPKEKCWEVCLNGKVIPHDQIDHVVSKNAGMGLAVHYGRVGDAGYAQAVVEKPGGSTIVPICFHPDAGVLVGVLEQDRPLQSKAGPVLNVPRGFRLPDEAFDQAADRELLEELGGLVSRIKPVKGCGVHMDNALITYSTGSCGDYFFYVEVKPTEVHLVDGGWRFIDGLVAKPSKQDEKILGCKFITVKQVMAEVEDAYTRLGLLGALYDLDRILA